MREIRLSGLEGGGAAMSALPTPIRGSARLRPEGGAVGGAGFGAYRQGPRGGLGGGALVVARGEHLTGGLRRRRVSGVGGAEGGERRKSPGWRCEPE